MAKQLYDNIQRFCDRYSEELNKIFPNTELHFIIHHRGQRSEQIAKRLPLIHGHPAYDEAAGLLKFRSPGSDTSAFLGMVIGFKKTLLGMRKNPECLAFISININEHSSEEDMLFSIHALTAHFLETVDFYTQKHAGTQSSQILQPKRNNISTARMNLRSDVYSTIMMSHQGDKDAIGTLCKKRAMNALTPQASHPEEFPFPIAMDVSKFALETFEKVQKRSIINSAFAISKKVAASFDAENFETWISFVNAAQSMAWAGYIPSQILGAAIHGSPNPFIKSTAQLLAEITDITPDNPEDIPSGMNPFALPEVNYIEHQRSIEETFEMVLIHAMEAESHLPMIHVANNQNEGLLKGRISGWCAHALQSAAQAYQNAGQRGMPSEQAARLEFQSAKQQTGWKELNQLSTSVVDMHRGGQIVTMSGIAKWCEDNPAFKPIMESLNHTLTDPSYNRKLELAAGMPAPGPRMAQDFAPSAGLRPVAPSAAPAGPAMMAAPSMGLGGGMGAAAPLRMPARPPNEPKKNVEDDGFLDFNSQE